MKTPNIYHGYVRELSEIIVAEYELLEGDENEIYFYTTPALAGQLRVGYTNIITIFDTQVNLFIGSIETRVSGHLPEKDAVLFPDQNLAELFAKAVGTQEKYQWGVLVGGEIIR